jgi:hypothetical protein
MLGLPPFVSLILVLRTVTGLQLWRNRRRRKKGAMRLSLPTLTSVAFKIASSNAALSSAMFLSSAKFLSSLRV